MKAALYARVSTTDQKCEMQLTELRAYVQARSWEVHKEYVDKGFSGKTSKRPALQACIADARKRKFDVVLVWKLDRWGRTVIQLVSDILDFDSMGVRFISTTQGIDTDKTNPMSRLLLHIMAAFAEFERSVIHERVTTGSIQYKADWEAGKVGKTRNSRSGRNLAPHRPRTIFNRERAAELKAEGMSYRQIAAEMGINYRTIHRALVQHVEESV